MTRFMTCAALATSFAVAACQHPVPTMAPTPVTVAPTGRDSTASRQPAASDAAPSAPSGASSTDTADVSKAEVSKAALQVFGDSVAAAVPATDSAADAGSMGLDLHAYETQERVAHYVKLFSGDARDRIEVRLERGSRYEPMMRAKLRNAGLPEDLVYLALIESGYDPNAYSRAAAVGMWQLMTGTARGVGLRVDWWVDERRDPVRSTDAAIKFLSYLNDQFGSMYLAAAAYNGGPGRVSRGLERYADDLQGTTGEDRYFALAEKDYLRTETRNYVPQLIAAALVAKQPARYGLTLRTEPAYSYDTVTVPASTPLAAVAKALGVPLAQVAELNPHVLRGVTPPKTPFVVRVPTGSSAGFDTAFARLSTEDRTAYVRTTSKKGETLAAISRRTGVSSEHLRWYNPKIEIAKKSGKVVAGQVILVPSAGVLAAAHDVPDPAIEIYGSSKSAVYHTVKRGESLGLIARRYKTTTAALMRMNGLRKSLIIPGQRLLVRGGSARAAKSSRGATKGKASRGRSTGRKH